MDVMTLAEILFLLGFSLHNLEEGLWLPRWSRGAAKYHKPVGEEEFRFSVIMVTALGYLITFQYFLFAPDSVVSRYLYLGFIAMMVLNVIFPHLAATITLRKYAPGLATGLFLNLPLGLYIIQGSIRNPLEILFLAIAALLVSAFVLMMISVLFRAGKRLLRFDGAE